MTTKNIQNIQEIGRKMRKSIKINPVPASLLPQPLPSLPKPPNPKNNNDWITHKEYNELKEKRDKEWLGIAFDVKKTHMEHYHEIYKDGMLVGAITGSLAASMIIGVIIKLI